jgi:hypothetical protein
MSSHFKKPEPIEPTPITPAFVQIVTCAAPNGSGRWTLMVNT